MQKRILFVLFTFINLSLMFGQTSTQPYGGGTQASPYQISTIDNLYWLSQNSLEWDKYYLQVNNIDAQASNGWDGNAGFTPIGNSTTSFTGTYSGNDKTISNITINRSGTTNIGLFGKVDGGSISRLGVTSLSITGNSSTGGLVGTATNSTNISNCYSTGTVTGGSTSGGSGNVGGL